MAFFALTGHPLLALAIFRGGQLRRAVVAEEDGCGGGRRLKRRAVEDGRWRRSVVAGAVALKVKSLA